MEAYYIYIVALAIAILVAFVFRLIVKLCLAHIKVLAKEPMRVSLDPELIVIGICTFVIALYFFLV